MRSLGLLALVGCAPVQVPQPPEAACPVQRPFGPAGDAYAEGMVCSYASGCFTCDDDAQEVLAPCRVEAGDWVCETLDCLICEPDGTDPPLHTDPPHTGDTDPQASVPTGCDDPTPRIDLGTGQDAFVPLTDGDELAMVAGPQGGHHVLAAVRFWHVPGPVTLQLELTVAGSRVAFGVYTLQPGHVQDCLSERTDLYGFLFAGDLGPGPVTTLLAGRDATFTATATADARVLTQSRAVQLIVP